MLIKTVLANIADGIFYMSQFFVGLGKINIILNLPVFSSMYLVIDFIFQKVPSFKFIRTVLTLKTFFT